MQDAHPYKLDSAHRPRFAGRTERGLRMTAVYMIAAFIALLAVLNLLEKGRLD
ncbi:MAG: hypothetical protein RIC52_11555 [Amphiplicatus sp.]